MKDLKILAALIVFAITNFALIYFGAVHSIKNTCGTLPEQCYQINHK